MKDTIALSVEHVSKRYTIGMRKNESFRGSLNALFNKNAYDTSREFWALKDVSFEVNKGDVVGIIGRNGAGKSTLLKLLSQITRPTEGIIKLNGRVASLLEVGTGFHQELTGRENIYLNGTILGMTREEVKAKFDEIVAFSGIEKFIDTAVKHYSSGMYVRLAFAVAAHLEPEILIIDEVLAVGDAEFQKKCLGKMQDVAGEGRTVLFVSHNMAAVKTLCTKGIVLNQGKVVGMGEIQDCLDRYFNLEKAESCFKIYEKENRPKSEFAELISYCLKNNTNEAVNSFNLYENAYIEIEVAILELSSDQDNFLVNLHFFDNDNNVFFIASVDANNGIKKSGVFKTIFELPALLFNTGFYRVSIALTSYPGTLVHFFENPAFTFEVKEDDMSKRTIPFNGQIPGISRTQLNYKTIEL